MLNVSVSSLSDELVVDILQSRVTGQDGMDTQDVLEAGTVRLKLRCLLYEKAHLGMKEEQVSLASGLSI